MHESQATGGLPIIRPTPLNCSPRSAQGLTLMSDLHLGAANVDYSLIGKELKAARRVGDRILLGGDVFDLILPQDTKRFDPEALHPRIRGRSDLQNAAVEWAFELLAPYANLVDAIGIGNHEAAAIRKTSYDAARALVAALNTERNSDLRPIAQLGYTGYLDYRLRPVREGGSEVRSAGRYVVWYHHGSGRCSTAAAALKNLLTKTGVFAADLYWSGHSHARAHCTEVMIHCGRSGRPVTRDVKCVVTGSYMVPYGHQSQKNMDSRGRKSNYASEMALAPHGLGGARVVLRWDSPGFPSRVEVVQ